MLSSDNLNNLSSPKIHYKSILHGFLIIFTFLSLKWSKLSIWLLCSLLSRHLATLSGSLLTIQIIVPNTTLWTVKETLKDMIVTYAKRFVHSAIKVTTLIAIQNAKNYLIIVFLWAATVYAIHAIKDFILIKTVNVESYLTTVSKLIRTLIVLSAKMDITWMIRRNAKSYQTIV